MIDSRIKKFLKLHSCVSIDEIKLANLLVDFLDSCVSAKRKLIYVLDDRPKITKNDKELILSTLEVYLNNIYFDNNELAKDVENKESLMNALCLFACFCIFTPLEPKKRATFALL